MVIKVVSEVKTRAGAEKQEVDWCFIRCPLTSILS